MNRMTDDVADLDRATDVVPAEPAEPLRGKYTYTFAIVFILLTGAALLGVGLYHSFTDGRVSALIGPGAIVIAIGVALLVLSDRGATGAGGESAETLRALRQANETLVQINDRMLISDHAKRIAYRQRDRHALRDAIIQDIRAEDYEAAAALIDEMADTYGYREEAEQFRQQLIEVQTTRRDALLTKAVKRIDDICAKHDWDSARHEAARLKRLYPDHPRVVELPSRIDAAREQHKNDLEREFLQAAERDDIERAMELVKELDRYLTPDEAAHYMETARGVIGKKRQNLGVRFKMAAQDRDWVTALQVGEQIVKEFPNSRFADEVRSMTDVLRQRAAAQRAAEAEKQSV